MNLWLRHRQRQGLDVQNAILTVLSLSCCAIFGYGIKKLIDALTSGEAYHYYILLIASFVLVAVFWLSKYIRSSIKVYIVIISLSSVFSIYAIEVYLWELSG